MASAGRILIMPKGEWKAGTQYEMLDLVQHNGIAWLAKKTTDTEPSTDNEEFWMSMFDVATIESQLSDLKKFQTNINERISERLSFRVGVDGGLQVYIDNELYGTVAFVDNQ